MSPWRRSSTITRKTNNNKIKPNYIVNARFRRRSFHEPNLVRIKADPNFLDGLNWFRCQTRFKRIKMLSSVKLLAKYVIIIYTLGNAHEKFVVWIKTVPKSLQEAKFSARLSGWAVPTRPLPSLKKTLTFKLGIVHSLSCENGLYLRENEKSFPYQRLST